MGQRILVTGATGTIGRHLVHELQQRKADFATLVSRSGRSVPGMLGMEGDFADPVSLERAFRGFDVLFLLLPLVPEKVALGRHAVQAAQAAGMHHIVVSSAAGADADSPVAIARAQGEVDRLVQMSGLQWTVLRPSFFMQNWVNFHAGQLKTGAYRAPHGQGTIGWIDARDIAESAAAVLADPSAHAGRTYDLTGAEALTDAQALHAISEATGRRIEYVDVSEAAAEEALNATGMPAVLISWFMSLHHVVKQGWAGGLTDDVRRLTGHAPRPFLNFVRENADAWK